MSTTLGTGAKEADGAPSDKFGLPAGPVTAALETSDTAGTAEGEGAADAAIGESG